MNSTVRGSELERQLRDMNEALLVSSVRQHELTEQAQHAEAALRESEERLARELTATRQLQAAGALLIEGGDIHAFYQKIVEAAAAIMRSDGASMQRLDDGQDALRLLAWQGFDPAFGRIFALNPLDARTSCSVAARAGHRVVVPDVETCDFIAGTPVLEDLRRTGIRAVQSTPLFSRGGRLLGVISTHWRSPYMPTESELRQLDILARQAADVIERRQAEAALEDSEAKYRRLFESAQDAILILDAGTGEITDANPYTLHLLGYSLAELVDQELWELGMFEDKEAIRSAFRQLQQEGYIRFEHLPLATKDGDKVEVELVSNVYEVDRKPVIQCNIRDITDRRRLERQAREQAEALADLHRRKDEFLAMLSHELRNPLAPIANAVHILRLQENEGPLQQQARAIIERQVGQLARLVDDLLEVSRITTGRVQLHQERVAMSGIVEHAVETVRSLIDQRKHELTVSLPPQPIWLYGDSARLEQVVVNLLRNAAKYTDQGGQIWLTVEQEGDEAVLRVRDTGVGIAPELLPRIFDLFTQAERSLDRSQGGLGIGLALVQRLVEMHRGHVQACSVLGEGSEFVVRLPLEGSAVPQSSSAPRETVEPAGPSLRVLVVDDNVDATQSLAMLLGMSRHQVRTAYDGPTALAAALDFRPDVVLLDIGLPTMDGYEVAEKMRQEPVLTNILLVAMTGYGQESDRQRSLEAGFDHHLVKPTDFGKVQQILATVSAKAT